MSQNWDISAGDDDKWPGTVIDPVLAFFPPNVSYFLGWLANDLAEEARTSAPFESVCQIARALERLLEPYINSTNNLLLYFQERPIKKHFAKYHTPTCLIRERNSGYIFVIQVTFRRTMEKDEFLTVAEHNFRITMKEMRSKCRVPILRGALIVGTKIAFYTMDCHTEKLSDENQEEVFDGML